MNYKLLASGAAGLSLSAGLITACHDGNSNPPATMGPTTQSDTTGQVLALAQQTTETGSPIAVNDGVFQISDTSDTSQPIAVNAM